MKKIMDYIKAFLFGVRTQGERLPQPSPLKERPFNQKDYDKWCKEFKVSMLYDRKTVCLCQEN